MSSRAEGERDRIRYLASNLKAMLSMSLEIVVKEGHGAAEVGQNIAAAAVDLAMKLAKLEAYTFVAQAPSLGGLDHNALRACDKESLRNEIERLRCLLHDRAQTGLFGPCAPARDPVDRDVTPQNIRPEENTAKRLTPLSSRWRWRADLTLRPVEIVDDPANVLIRYARPPNAMRYSIERLDFMKDYVRIVCTTCDDTHVIHSEERGTSWACTSCPTPCEHCRVPQGAFCKTTPCNCRCHEGKVGYL